MHPYPVLYIVTSFPKYFKCAAFLESNRYAFVINHLFRKHGARETPQVCALQESAADRSLRLRVRFPPQACTVVPCECLLSSGGPCDWPIIRPEESHRLCGVSLCVIENSQESGGPGTRWTVAPEKAQRRVLQEGKKNRLLDCPRIHYKSGKYEGKIPSQTVSILQ